MNKHILSISLYFITFSYGFAQEEEKGQQNYIGIYTQKIIAAQIEKKLGWDFPLIIGISGFLYLTKFTIPNERIYYPIEGENLYSYSDLNKVGLGEIRQGIQFNNGNESHQGFLLNAYVKERLVLSLKGVSDKQYDKISISSPSSKRSKIDVYENNKLLTSTISKRSKVVSFKDIPVDSLFSRNKMADFLTINESTKPSSISVLYKSNELSKENIIKIQHNFRDKDNRLLKVVSFTGNREEIDSTIFVYKDNLLTRSKNFANRHVISLQFFYDDQGRLVSKSIVSDKKGYNLIYAYDKAGKLSTVNIASSDQSAKVHKVHLTYNSAGNVISVAIINKKGFTKTDKIKSQFNLSYDDNRDIDGLLQINGHGKIKKQITFVSEML